MASQDNPDTTRGDRLEARVSAAQKRLLQHAAALSDRTLSEFVVTSAHDAARRVIAEHESIWLSREVVERPRPVAWITAGKRANRRAGSTALRVVDARRFMRVVARAFA